MVVGEPALETHVVKKYSNRKLYDTYTRRYVTLDVIAELVRRGDEVRVVDRNSGEDITAVTLSQVLLDLERQRRSPLPEPVLVDLVKERGEQLIGMIRSSLALPRELRQRAADSLGKGTQSLEKGVDEMFTGSLRNLGLATQDDLSRLEERVEQLAAKLDALLDSSGTASRRGRARR